MSDERAENTLTNKVQPALMRSFPCFTGGKHPNIDRLGIAVQCFEEMDERERNAAMNYLAARWR